LTVVSLEQLRGLLATLTPASPAAVALPEGFQPISDYTYIKDKAIPRGEDNLVHKPHRHDAILQELGRLHHAGVSDYEERLQRITEWSEANCAGELSEDHRVRCTKDSIKWKPPVKTELDLNQGKAAAEDKERRLAQDRQEYEALVDECQREEERELNPYPVDAWKNTPYYDFALTCQGSGRDRNYIPLEFFINGMMTMVGGICGNRITPVFNPTLQARFITLLLTKIGGIGKGTIFDWCEVPFKNTELVYRHNGLAMTRYQRIGCFAGSFGSARGMGEVMIRQPRILQMYGEFSTLVEKFGITGSGDAFRDLILNAADSQTPEWSIIKGLKVNPEATKEISNSVLAGTTEERWHEMMAKTNLETFIQRSNIVPSDEDRTVFKLVTPDLAKFKDVFVPRITMLDTYKLIWELSAEAEKMGEAWYEKMHELMGGEEDGMEAVGRIQVFLFRIISHMALWHAPTPAVVPFDPSAGRPDLEWRYTVGPDVMAAALKVAEHQIRARRDWMPTRGTGDAGIIENLIRKWAFKNRTIRWIELKRRSKIARFGAKKCRDAMMQVQGTGVISVQVNPDKPSDERDWVILWVGSKGNHKKWRENRGGKRVNPETGKGYRSSE
jgi:hypothetical protein